MYMMVEKNEEKKEEPIADLKSVVERLEKANAEKDALLRREEELRARQILGGKTDAGVQPEPMKPDTPKDYIRKVLSGEIQLEKG